MWLCWHLLISSSSLLEPCEVDTIVLFGKIADTAVIEFLLA